MPSERAINCTGIRSKRYWARGGGFFITYLSAINEYRVNDSVSWNELAVFNWDMEKDSFWI
jgi:hypothetical protein